MKTNLRCFGVFNCDWVNRVLNNWIFFWSGWSIIIKGMGFSAYPLLGLFGDVAVDEPPGGDRCDVKPCRIESLEYLPLGILGLPCRRPLTVNVEGNDHVPLVKVCRHPVGATAGSDGIPKEAFLLLAPSGITIEAGGL